MTDQKPDRRDICTCGQAGHGNAHEPGCPLSDKPVRQDDKCAGCGIVRKQHDINGEAYGVCGKFVEPDRQDGDEMQQARDIVTAYFDCHGIHNARAAGFNIVARIMEAGLTVVPSPTRDGAEGAGKHPNLKAGMAGLRAASQFNHAAAPPKPAPSWPQDAPPLRTELLGPDGMGSASEADLKRAYGVDQPAPDAMRRKLASARGLDSPCDNSSAPVSPADGTRQPKAPHCPNDGDPRCCYPNCECPSPAVAAEPIAWLCEDLIFPGQREAITNRDIANVRMHQLDAWKLTPLYASPTVRGDREAYARAICKADGHDYDDELELATKFETLRSREIISRANRYANAILSVQSGAGEREAVKRAVCCPDGCQYEGDSEDGSRCYCDTSDYHGSGVEKRANAVFAALFSRQAPHSSSETE